VQINPITRPDPPRSAREIQDRLNEIAFNSVLIKELRAAAMMRRVVDPGTGEGRALAEMRLHRIASDVMLSLGYSSKLLAEWGFFTMLRDEGRKAAEVFLSAHGADLGVRQTLDIDTYLEGI
jgi:NTE family protein